MNKPIRILCVFSTLDRGGAETMCMNLYRFIDRSIIQFDFVKHSSAEGDFEKEISALGGRIYEAPRFKWNTFIKYSNWWRRHFAKHPEHTIVHGHFFTISPIYFYFAKKYNRITIGHIHASGIRGRMKQYLVSKIEKYSDYCLACSKEAGEWAYPNKEFLVLKNAINTDNFKYNSNKRSILRKKYKLEEYFVVGTIANFSGVKNPIGLLHIFADICKKRPDSVLMWIGEGRLRAIIEEEIEKCNLKDKVILLGTRTDVADLLQMMDCFLLPSFREGLPVSVIEAQASGLPCFVSDRVTKDVDITGLCHFLPIEDVGAWTDAVLSNINNRLNTQELLKNAGYDIQDSAVWMQKYYLSINR